MVSCFSFSTGIFFFLQVYILLVHMSEFVVQWNSHETNSLETYEMCKCNTGNVFSDVVPPVLLLLRLKMAVCSLYRD